LIVFLFTHPLIAFLSRYKAFGSPRFSGLGGARPRDPVPPREGSSPDAELVVTKEA
jgi:preprotein translocase subunit SecD